MLSQILKWRIFWYDGIMARTWVAVVATFAMSVPTTSWAQPQPSPTPRFTREVSVGVGLGHVFVYEGNTLGDKLNIGGSLAIVHKSGFGVEFEVNRTLGFSPELARCAIEGTTCFGPTHHGIRSPTIASANLQYRFKTRRVQPYVMAGIGVMREKVVQGTGPIGGPDMLGQTEAEVSDTGFGPDLGAGLRVPLFRAISINPEIRWLEASFFSRSNLAVTRVVVRTAYSW
jgi:opacity protein-like surface antigen